MFEVYSRDGCPYCTKVVQVLQLAELKFVEHKLGRDFTRDEFYNQFGPGSTFPGLNMKIDSSVDAPKQFSI